MPADRGAGGRFRRPAGRAAHSKDWQGVDSGGGRGGGGRKGGGRGQALRRHGWRLQVEDAMTRDGWQRQGGRAACCCSAYRCKLTTARGCALQATGNMHHAAFGRYCTATSVKICTVSGLDWIGCSLLRGPTCEVCVQVARVISIPNRCHTGKKAFASSTGAAPQRHDVQTTALQVFSSLWKSQVRLLRFPVNGVSLNTTIAKGHQWPEA